LIITTTRIDKQCTRPLSSNFQFKKMQVKHLKYSSILNNISIHKNFNSYEE